MEKHVGISEQETCFYDKVTGRTVYTADIQKDNILEITLVRSTFAHARLLNISFPKLPADCYVFTAKDLVKNQIPFMMNDMPVLASDHIRFHGEPVAIVASPSKEKADEIASLVEVEYEKYETVDSIQDALEEKAKLYDSGNICTTFHSERGNAQEVSDSCDLVTEGVFETPVQIHGFIEPECAFTYINEDGKLVIACGKDGNTACVFPAVVTSLTKRPARLVFTREEDVRYFVKHRSSIVKAKLGFSKDGIIRAAKIEMLLDTGAYVLCEPSVFKSGLEHFAECYNIENVTLDGKLICTNHVPASAICGFWNVQAVFAVENLISRAASELGLDQIEIRQKNVVPTSGAGQALKMFEKSAFHKEMKEKPQNYCGYGLALGITDNFTDAAFTVQGAKVKVDPLTGKIDVLWIHNTAKIGSVKNSQLYDGFVFGGVSMGLGMTLTEQVRYKDGISLENSFANYNMPTALDVPLLTNEFVSTEENTEPSGKNETAELSAVAVAPAITSAVESLYENLTMNKLPVDRMSILKARRIK